MSGGGVIRICAATLQGKSPGGGIARADGVISFGGSQCLVGGAERTAGLSWVFGSWETDSKSSRFRQGRAMNRVKENFSLRFFSK
jgi:hypothetical protein